MSPQPAHAKRSRWSLIKQALTGSHHDFTEGSLSEAVALLAIPMVLEMSMESLFGFVDALFVARLGKEAVATVVLTESLLTILFGVAMGLSFSTTAMVARRFGERDHEGAARSAVQAILLGIMASAMVGITGWFGAPTVLRWMGAEPAIIQVGARYTATFLGTSVVIFLLFLMNAIFRGAGDPSMALRSLIIANSINIVLDPCLIFGLGPFPKLGLMGAAVATTIGRTAGVAFQFYALLSGHSRLRLETRHLRFDPAVMWTLLKVSISGILQVQIAMASWLGMVRITSLFGSAALAGYGLAIRTIVVMILPAWGMANAAATLVGQNLGAGKPERAERAVWVTGFYNMCFLGVVGLVFIVWAEWVMSWYGVTGEVMRYGVDCLRFVSYGYLAYAWGMVMVQAFNGAGDTLTPTFINLGCYWMLQIPLAYVLSVHAGLGPRGVFLAITIAESVIAVVGVLAFRRGRWKTKKI
jgi:putative MATE family efflux protein